MMILGKRHETKLKLRFFKYENKLFSKQKKHTVIRCCCFHYCKEAWGVNRIIYKNLP